MLSLEITDLLGFRLRRPGTETNVVFYQAG
jgi:hypothetical protein